jgi:hypothetical protein
LVLRTVKLLHRRIFMVLANPAYYLYASWVPLFSLFLGPLNLLHYSSRLFLLPIFFFFSRLEDSWFWAIVPSPCVSSLCHLGMIVYRRNNKNISENDSKLNQLFGLSCMSYEPP